MPEFSFYDNPILNSPYAEPTRHWELDSENQPTGHIKESRRKSSFISPVPPSRKGAEAAPQSDMVFDDPEHISTREQQYATMANINELRRHVGAWRDLRNENHWGVTYITRELLRHWRSGKFDYERPFFCQVEALETIIWLTEVAPKQGQSVRRYVGHLAAASDDANPGLERWALKMATGSGKTTVMAMLIAWQTLNAIEYPRSSLFTRNFLEIGRAHV